MGKSKTLVQVFINTKTQITDYIILQIRKLLKISDKAIRLLMDVFI